MATIQELVDQGVRHMKLAKWASPSDHITVEVSEQWGLMPWVTTSFKFQNAEMDTVDKLLLVQCELHDPDWVEWKAPDGVPAT